MDLLKRIDDMKEENDYSRNDDMLHQSTITESRIQELRHDLESTLEDWQRSESDRARKEASNQQLEHDLFKEKEKSCALKSTLVAVEDRLRTCTKELDMYKSLDIYRISMETELKGFRETRDVEKSSMSSGRAMSVEKKRDTESSLRDSYVGIDPFRYTSMHDISAINTPASHNEGSARKRNDIHDLSLSTPAAPRNVQYQYRPAVLSLKSSDSTSSIQHRPESDVYRVESKKKQLVARLPSKFDFQKAKKVLESFSR